MSAYSEPHFLTFEFGDNPVVVNVRIIVVLEGDPFSSPEPNAAIRKVIIVHVDTCGWWSSYIGAIQQALDEALIGNPVPEKLRNLPNFEWCDELQGFRALPGLV